MKQVKKHINSGNKLKYKKRAFPFSKKVKYYGTSKDAGVIEHS